MDALNDPGEQWSNEEERQAIVRQRRKTTDAVITEWQRRRSGGYYQELDLLTIAPPITLYHIHLLLEHRDTVSAVLDRLPDQDRYDYVSDGETLLGKKWYLVLANKNMSLSFDTLHYLRQHPDVLAVCLYRVRPEHLLQEEE